MCLYTIPGLCVQCIRYKARDAQEMEELLRRVQAYITIIRFQRHPGLPTILNYKDTESELYVDWEVLDGVSLEEKYCRTDKRMALPEICDCLRQIADPMIRMHEVGLAIRNIQSGLILIDQQDDVTQKITAQHPEYKLNVWNFPTVSGETFDINYYCRAPEQFVSYWGQPGPPADVYALAMTLYILITGHGPFDKTEMLPSQIISQHLHDMATLQGLPAPLRPVFQVALSKNPGERPKIREFYADFEEAYKQIPGPPPRTAVVAQRIYNSRITRRTALGILGLAGIAIAVDGLSHLPWEASSLKKKINIGDWLITPFTGHQSTVNVVHPSPNGSMILSADAGGLLLAWDLSKKVLLDDPYEHAGSSIVDAAWAPNSQFLASIDDSGLVVLWSIKDGPIATSPLPFRGRAIAWSPTGDHLIAAAGNQVYVFDDVLHNTFGQMDLGYLGHRDRINSLVLSPDGKRAFSVADDKTAQLWLVEPVRWLHTFHEYKREVSAVAYSPDGNSVASGDVDSYVRVRDAKNYKMRFHYNHQEAIRSLAFSSDSRSLASGGDDNVVRIYNDGKISYIYRRHQASVNSVAWLRNYVVSASSKEVHIWRGK